MGTPGRLVAGSKGRRYSSLYSWIRPFGRVGGSQVAVTFLANMSASASLGTPIPEGMSSSVMALTQSLNVDPAAFDTLSRYS